MEKIIEVNGLTKSYGSVPAVQGIDFYVEKGKLFAFLGPNGAGKSTTIDILSTILQADSGQVMINGHRLGEDDQAIRSSIGVVFQGHLLDDLLTVEENLTTRGSFYGLTGSGLRQAVAQAAATAGCREFLHRPYGKLSGGQRRRADVARALVNTPRILFLDEPTTGLDAQTRRNLWASIHDLQQAQEMTVFLTTHYMEEASQADYVIVIDHGRIAAKGTPAQLKATYATDVLRLWPTDPESVEVILAKQGISYTAEHDLIIVAIPDTLSALPIIDRCKEWLAGFEVAAGSMDDVFIGITGKEIRE